MINVNQITSQLARMPDQALQQYAMMHKNDPYTVSLALSESNRRKQMRNAAQGQQGMAPQPKVVDQGIAGMLPTAPQPQMPQEQAQPMPEDVGIGALPAPNMQGMAEGGIVAFSGQGPSVVQDMSPDAINERYRQAQLQKLKDLFGFTDTRRGFQSGFTPEEKLTGVAAPVMGPAVSAVYPDGSQRGAMAKPAPIVPAPTVKPPPVAGPRPAPAPAAPRAAVVPAGDYLTQLDAMKARAGDVVDPTALLKQNQTTKEVQAEEAALAQRKIEQKAEFEEMFKGKEERIGKREAELGKSKDTNTGMAFLEAGLAMMQARGPGLAGIAQGAGVGLKQYASGIKDIKAAQEKLDDARDRIEELRQNQSSMNKSEVRNAEKGIRAIVNQGDRELIKGVETATGVQREDFRAAVTSNMAVAQADKARATTLEAARIAAGPGMERNKMLAASQSDTAKARTEYGKLQTKVMTDLGNDPQYITATDAVKAQMATTRLRAALLNNPFLSAYAAGIGFASTPSDKVRELDAD